MTKTIGSIILPIIALIFLGCETSSSGNYLKNSRLLVASALPEDYGPPPPRDYEETEELIIRLTTRYPHSITFLDHSENSINPKGPYKATVPQEKYSSEPILVWNTTRRFKAQNSFGNLVESEYVFSWKDGELFCVLSPLTGYTFY